MSNLDIRANCLGFELYEGESLVTLYRATGCGRCGHSGYRH